MLTSVSSCSAEALSCPHVAGSPVLDWAFEIMAAISSTSVAGSSSVSLRVTSPDSLFTAVANLLLKSSNSYWLSSSSACIILFVATSKQPQQMLLVQEGPVHLHSRLQEFQSFPSKTQYSRFSRWFSRFFFWASLRLSLSLCVTGSVYCFVTCGEISL